MSGIEIRRLHRQDGAPITFAPWVSSVMQEPIAAELPTIAEILGVDLEAVIQAARGVAPYHTATGEAKWSVLWVGVALGVRERPRKAGLARQDRKQRQQERERAG